MDPMAAHCKFTTQTVLAALLSLTAAKLTVIHHGSRLGPEWSDLLLTLQIFQDVVSLL